MDNLIVLYNDLNIYCVNILLKWKHFSVSRSTLSSAKVNLGYTCRLSSKWGIVNISYVEADFQKKKKEQMLVWALCTLFGNIIDIDVFFTFLSIFLKSTNRIAKGDAFIAIVLWIQCRVLGLPSLRRSIAYEPVPWFCSHVDLYWNSGLRFKKNAIEENTYNLNYPYCQSITCRVGWGGGVSTGFWLAILFCRMCFVFVFVWGKSLVHYQGPLS